MSSKILTTVIVVFSIAIIGLFGGAFYLTVGGSGETSALEKIRGYLPFGDSAPEIDTTLPQGRDTLPPAPPAAPPPGGAAAGGEQSPSLSAARLGQVTTAPAAGFHVKSETVLERAVESLMYVERQTGHVYRIDPDGTDKKRLSNTTIPAVREVVWGDGGNSVVLRYLGENDVIKSFAGSLSAGEGLAGPFLPDEAGTIAASPAGDRLFMAIPSGTGIIGMSADFRGENRKELLSSPFTEWLAAWPAGGTVTLATKPSASAEGYFYFLDAETGAMEKAVGGVHGLTAIASPELSFIVYSESGEGKFQTFLYNTETKRRTQFPVTTLPEKCAWSRKNEAVLYCGVPEVLPNAEHPDLWYQGRLSYTDSIWKVNIENGSIDLLLAPRTAANREIDIINPKLSPNEQFLIFMDKKDSTIWSLRLAQ